MSEHTSINASPQKARTSPALGSNRPATTVAASKPGRFASTLDRLFARRVGSRSAAKPVASNEHSGSLRYEHVHRVEITISLLAGIAGRVQKP
jgi:hypothetical protein